MLISSGYSSSGRQAAPGSGLHPGGDGARLPGARRRESTPLSRRLRPSDAWLGSAGVLGRGGTTKDPTPLQGCLSSYSRRKPGP